MKNSQSEAKIQSECFLWLYNNYPNLRGLVYHVPNGGYRGQQEANTFRAMGVVAGIPDLVIAVPRMRLGRVESISGIYGKSGALYIEMKTDKGVMSESQKKVHQKLIEAGNTVVLCRTVEEFKQIVEDYLTGTDFEI